MKVKSTLVGNEQPTNPTNWDKPQLLFYELHDKENSWIVQSNGKHKGDKFQGTVVWSGTNATVRVGDFGTTWTKKAYIILSTSQQVILQNTPDEL